VPGQGPFTNSLWLGTGLDIAIADKELARNDLRSRGAFPLLAFFPAGRMGINIPEFRSAGVVRNSHQDSSNGSRTTNSVLPSVFTSINPR
jgi:hypothetical protein